VTEAVEALRADSAIAGFLGEPLLQALAAARLCEEKHFCGKTLEEEVKALAASY